MPLYTPDIEKILALAQKNAQKRQNSLVEEIDIFSGLLEHENSIIDEILKRSKVAKSEIMAEIGRKFPFKAPQIHSKTELSYKPSTQTLFTQARQESQKYADSITSSSHLLLALAKNESEDTKNIFQKFSLDYEKLTAIFEQLAKLSQTPYLDKYGQDITMKAALGKLDPLIGRTAEIEQIIQILARRRKNNPLIYGEAGVGKTILVEGIANMIYTQSVPKRLLGKRIIELNIYSIIAGATHRGEFEERLKNIISETKNSQGQIILFMDEIHSIVSHEAGSETANILKPALARGEIQVIGATTVKEYHRYFEKDAALERRFQPIHIAEPDIEECIFILQHLKTKYEEHHSIAISDELIAETVKLSQRFISRRFLPDKALDLLDQTCAVTAFQKNQTITKEILYQTVAKMSGVSYLSINLDQKSKILTLDQNLQQKIIGQNEAIQALANAIKRSYAGLKNKNQPIGSFLFLGPTGVGKTETAEVLAEELFGEKKALIRFDMSEYMEKHSQAKLIGAPPGYVGYEEGGTLTSQIQNKPYSIVLFDEIEKAHPDILNLLLQILDEGHLTDNQGHLISFKNTLIILTSNLGSEINPADIKTLNGNGKRKKLIPSLRKFFKNELINRLDEIIYFDSLDQTELRQILALLIKDLNSRLIEKKLSLSLTEKAIHKLLELGYDPEFGARPLRRTVQNEIETPLAELILKNEAQENKIVTVDFANSNFSFLVSYNIQTAQ